MKEQTLWSGGRLDSEMDREMIQLNNSLWMINEWRKKMFREVWLGQTQLLKLAF